MKILSLVFVFAAVIGASQARAANVGGRIEVMSCLQVGAGGDQGLTLNIYVEQGKGLMASLASEALGGPHQVGLWQVSQVNGKDGVSYINQDKGNPFNLTVSAAPTPNGRKLARMQYGLQARIINMTCGMLRGI